MAKLVPFPRTYNLTDFGITANVVCPAGKFTKVGEVVVGAEQVATFGIGNSQNGVDTRRTAYVRLDTTTGIQLTGKLRLKLANATETREVCVCEERTETFSADQTDRTKALLLGEFPTKAKEDQKLVIEFYPDGDSDVTVDYDGTNTKIIMPITVYQ